MEKSLTIAVVGLGRLGLTLAAALASRGFSVIGVDIDPDVVQAINGCRLPTRISEPGLEELLAEGQLVAVFNVGSAVRRADVTIVLVPTSGGGVPGLSLRHVLSVCDQIGSALRETDKYHLVIVSSNIAPGSCEQIRLTLEAASGGEIGSDFGLCYCPEFVALGNVLKGFLEPDYILIGNSDEKAANLAKGIYRRLTVNDPPTMLTSLLNAEVIKMAQNCYLATKVTAANQLAELCEVIPGADIDIVSTALGLDSRISPKFLRGGTAYGGPSFPSAMTAMQEVGGRCGAWMRLFEMVEILNVWQTSRLAQLVQRHAYRIQAKTVGILGLTYKPGTPSTERSAGLALISALEYLSQTVIAFDPAAQIGQSVKTAQICADRADVVVLVTPWPEFRNVRFREGQVVIDCWRMLDRESVVRQGAEYFAIGVGPCE